MDTNVPVKSDTSYTQTENIVKVLNLFNQLKLNQFLNNLLIELSISDACGGVFDASNGTITSPSFPETYPGNKNCIWEIIAPLHYRITLNFTHFDLEGNRMYQQECDYDFVEVSSKLGDDILKKHGIFCGSKIPTPIISEGNAMRIAFTSDKKLVFTD